MTLLIEDWRRRHDLWCHPNTRNTVTSTESDCVWIEVTYRNGWKVRGVLAAKRGDK